MVFTSNLGLLTSNFLAFPFLDVTDYFLKNRCCYAPCVCFNVMSFRFGNNIEIHDNNQLHHLPRNDVAVLPTVAQFQDDFVPQMSYPFHGIQMRVGVDHHQGQAPH